jgi:hypothetical protein
MGRRADAPAAPATGSTPCASPARRGCYSLIREEPNRYPPEHTAYARPIANVSSWPAGPLDRLEPNAANDSHPYPVELRLPRWTVAEDWDLRSWLFRWGNGVRIEQPLALREQHLSYTPTTEGLNQQPLTPSNP